MTLHDYNVQPFSTINLVVILYNIPESFDEVIFDLFWGYPATGRDHLDVSVLLYAGETLLEVIDFRRTRSKTCAAVKHSGDDMNDDENRIGHQEINVEIKHIKDSIDRLFFILSAYQSTNISMFPNPSLRFYDARFPDNQLCNDSMKHAADSQAIIMCSLCRIEGEWKVLSLRHLSDGNVKNYDPLKATVLHLIQSGIS